MESPKNAAQKEVGIGKIELPKNFLGKTTDEIQELLSQYEPQISNILSTRDEVKNLLQVCSIVARSKDVAKCTASTVVGAVLQTAMARLDPNPIMGEVYFIPREIKNGSGVYGCTLTIGYKGYIQFAERSGKIKSVYSYPIYSEEIFQAHYGTDLKIEHFPKPPKDRGVLNGAYSVVEYITGGKIIEVLYKDEIEKIRKLSPGSHSKYSPWVNFEADMYRKCPLRKIMKYVPLSARERKGMSVDDGIVDIETTTFQSDGVVSAEEINFMTPEDAKAPIKNINELLIKYESLVGKQKITPEQQSKYDAFFSQETITQVEYENIKKELDSIK